MRARIFLCAFLAASAAAQRPVYEPDDFIDPALHSGPVFFPRIVAAGVWNPTDHYRPIDGNSGFVLFTNSLYVERWQFDYKHTEAFGRDQPALQRCDCPEPVYFPTPPPDDATPAGPYAKRRDTLQLAFYHTLNATERAPVTLRYRLSFDRQDLHTVVRSIATGEIVERRSGHDQSLTVDADTHFRFLGRDVWGTLYFAHTSRSGTPHDDRAQNELAYVWRPPGRSAGEVLFRLNLVNPYLEAFWRHRDTRVNFHLVWSPQAARDGDGWQFNHEIALFADYTLKMFGR
jgi:hypothetical protein